MTTIRAPEKLYTPEDLLRIPDGDRYELVDGRLVERGMGAKSEWVAGQLGHRIRGFLETNPIGWEMAQSSYQCFPDAPEKVRKPDASFLRLGRLPGESIPDGHIRIPPDLAIEVVSPNDLFSEVEAKVDEYLAAGVRLVWVIDPAVRTAHVYRPGTPDALRLDENQELDGGDVLPGFLCPLREVFPPPA
ncbi:MAG: Uma2 family endonuclease [Planctomycetes bacterium]|nr:Uma2 family endonuclease [Planctomycetota bacterium]